MNLGLMTFKFLRRKLKKTKVVLTLGVGVGVLHDLGELFIHPFNQRQDAPANPVWLMNTQNKGN